ncbi:MAG TPA: DUF177 domain-containing protein [Firmicutes bacterium]|nr:DUF177 domain-containing protein [Bacillota bacterium]
MFVDLKQLFDIIGERREIEYSMDLSDYELFGGYPFRGPVRLSGEIYNKAGIVTLKMRVGFEFTTLCDRCAEEFTRYYEYRFRHVLVQKLNDSRTDKQDLEDVYIVVEDLRLDLDELMLSDILLSLPSKMLCRQDCAGLCPHCGKNLNDGSCDCTDIDV